MKGIQSLKASGLALLLVVSFISLSCCAPQRLFEKRNWTPQAILYLKGTQGRQFISEESQRKDLYNRLQLEKRSQSLNPMPISEAVAMFFEFLQKPPEEAREVNLDQSRFLEDDLLNWRK
ncbi:spexin [Trichosurus vulpecula]|uniref:spexin n=1 Tax=Trichosurus vulpecula TaxID=9337 RepID=UPI00186B0ED2|nr:spexin [Trichosurus vulpecula]